MAFITLATVYKLCLCLYKDMFLRSILKSLRKNIPLNLSMLSYDNGDNQKVKITWQPSVLGFTIFKKPGHFLRFHKLESSNI